MKAYPPKNYTAGSSFVLENWDYSLQPTTAGDLQTKVNSLRNELLDGVTTENLNSIKELSNALNGDENYSTSVTNALLLKAPKNNPTFTGTVAGITKSMVGLPNVDNTTDANKPVSTLTQTALDLKAPIASAIFTGNTTMENLEVSNYMRTATDEYINGELRENMTEERIVEEIYNPDSPPVYTYEPVVYVDVPLKSKRIEILNDGNGKLLCDKIVCGRIKTTEVVEVDKLNATTGITLGDPLEDFDPTFGLGDGTDVPKTPSFNILRTANIDNVNSINTVIIDALDIHFVGLLNNLITPAEVAHLTGLSAPIQTQINEIVSSNTNQDLSLNAIIAINDTQTINITENANNIVAVNNFASNNSARITTIENIGIETQFADIATAQTGQDNLITVLQGETSALATKDTALDADILALQNKDTALDASLNAIIAVNNTQTTNIATLTSSVNLKAPITSPTFLGTPSAPTAVSTNNTTQIATTAFVKTAIGELINGAPSTLDTLNELASAFQANESAITTTTNLIGTKLAITAYDADKAIIDTNITTNADAITAHGGRLTSLETADTNIQSQIDAIVAVDVVQQNTLDLKANISNSTVDNFTSRQTINIAEKISPISVSSGTLTANYANGAVFFVSNLTASSNWECLLTNINPTSSTGCSNVITLLINASVYETFASTCKINGTTRTLQFAGGIDAVDTTGATTICQTISVVYSGGSGVPIAVLSSVVPFF